jgi:hypothetical protein
METKLTTLSALLTLIVVTATASASATPQQQEVIIDMETSFILGHSWHIRQRDMKKSEKVEFLSSPENLQKITSPMKE